MAFHYQHFISSISATRLTAISRVIKINIMIVIALFLSDEVLMAITELMTEVSGLRGMVERIRIVSVRVLVFNLLMRC